MNILVKDEEGLGTALMMDGYSQNQIIEAKRAIRRLFSEAAEFVFLKIMGKELPETITVRMAQNDQDEIKGNKSVQLASFNAERSREGDLLFYIREKTVKGFMTGQDMDLFRATVFHEMFHAADLPVLAYEHKLIDAIVRQIDECRSTSCSNGDEYMLKALANLLHMLDHYRAEGVALLGEHLVQKAAFGSTSDSMNTFYFVFAVTLHLSNDLAMGTNASSKNIDELVDETAYISAPIVLLKVLGGRGDIPKKVCQKVETGLNTGNFELDEAEETAVLKAAMSLSAPMYIQGLLSLDDDLALVRPVLKLCGQMQNKYNPNDANSFIQMMRSEESVKSFSDSIRSILGCLLKEDDLDLKYKQFQQGNVPPQAYPELKEKLAELYSTMKTSSEKQKRELAQWALTYFFVNKDLIHDDLPGLGLVDDLIVIDGALRIIQR